MMASDARSRFPMSGRQLIAALAGIVIATAALPPAAAWSLNKSRVTETHARAVSAAGRLRAGGGHLAGTVTAGVACGPGRLPDLVPATATARAIAASLPAHRAWLLGASKAPELFGPGMPTDAWGRCFLMNAGAWIGGGPVWLLSAGPNGLVETPVDAPTVQGDDIAERVR